MCVAEERPIRENPLTSDALAQKKTAGEPRADASLLQPLPLSFLWVSRRPNTVQTKRHRKESCGPECSIYESGRMCATKPQANTPRRLRDHLSQPAASGEQCDHLPLRSYKFPFLVTKPVPVPDRHRTFARLTHQHPREWETVHIHLADSHF